MASKRPGRPCASWLRNCHGICCGIALSCAHALPSSDYRALTKPSIATRHCGAHAGFDAVRSMTTVSVQLSSSRT
eukprot:13031496-Ditylum_brightwellii.AAC.1